MGVRHEPVVEVSHIVGYMPVVALWHLHAATPEAEDGQLGISQGLPRTEYPGTCPQESWPRPPV